MWRAVHGEVWKVELLAVELVILFECDVPEACHGYLSWLCIECRPYERCFVRLRM